MGHFFQYSRVIYVQKSSYECCTKYKVHSYSFPHKQIQSPNKPSLLLKINPNIANNKQGQQNQNLLQFIQDIMSSQEPTLKWGDIIRIHGVNLSNKDNDKTKGLIVSKGFTDPNIYYQKYQQFDKVNLYRESLFQILPRSSFDMHDQMMQPNLSVTQKEQLRSRAINEVIGLQNNLKAKAGKQIMYGSQVIFRHVESQYYLRGILKAADKGQGAFRVDVCQKLSSQIIFKITTHRSYEHENDKIYYDDALQIYHPGADCFMNFWENTDDPIYLDQDLKLKPVSEGHPFYQFANQRPSIKKPHSIRIPVVNENKSKCLWKFIEHCSYDEYDKKNKIKSHDIVYFMHTKAGGLVSSTLAKPAKYYLKEKGSGLYYQCFWELIPKEVNQKGPEQCNSFWVKNVVTGEFLTYDGNQVEVQPQNFENQENTLDNKGLINLRYTLPGQQQSQILKLERGQKIPIPENIQKIVQKYQAKFEKINFISVSKMAKDIFKIYKVDEKTLLDLQYALSSHEPLVKLIEVLASGLIDQSYQKFNYPKFFLTLNEDFLINIITILKMLIGKIYNVSYEQILSSGNLPDENIQKILVETGIVQLVIQILNLLYKSFLFIESNKQSSDDRAIRNKISQIFEYSYRLLQKSAVNNEDNRMYISRWVDLFLLHSNKINQHYIQECLVGILQNNQQSILATIDRQKINQLIRSFFKQAEQVSAQTSLTTKYLKLFSTFIVCENRVIRENQNIILDDFFLYKLNQQIFRVKIQFKNDYQEDPKDVNDKIKSKEVFIAFGKQQFTTIPKFFRDWTSKWNYFIAYINLLADTCMDRNVKASNNVPQFLSLEMVVTILFDPDVEKLNNQIHEANKQSLAKTGQLKYPVTNVYEPFVRIAHYLYINNMKFDPVKRIKRISRWCRNQEIQGTVVEEINRTKKQFQGQKQQQQQKYLKSILVYIKNYLTKATQDSEQLSMLYIVLDVLKTTIVLGLWKSINQFKQLIPLIIMRITKIDNNKFFEIKDAENSQKTPLEVVKSNKQLLQMNRPDINKSIQCKIKATEIFKVMNQLQIDIRLRYIMNFFKGLYETTENFNIYDTPIVDLPIEGQTKLDQSRSQTAKAEFFKDDTKAILGQVKKVSEDQEIILKTNVWLNKLKQMTPFTFNPNADKVSDRYLFQGGISLTNKSNQQIIQEMNIHFQNIVLSLLELPIYKNQRLLSNGLKMLRSIFEQRKQLIDNFQTILICSKGNLQEVYLTLKFMRNKFQMLTNLNIEKYAGNQDQNFAYALWKPYDSFVKSQEKRSGIIQDLFFLSRTLKDNISLKNIQQLMRVEQEAFDSEQVYTFIDERQKNNLLFQALNIAEGIFLPLMQYVRIMGDKDVQIGSIHYKLLRSIFQYLTQVCYNNLQAKQLMIQYVPNVLPHLSKRVGASYFIYVVCYNNKILVSNEDLVALIIQSALQACIFDDNDNMYRMILNQFGKYEVKMAKDYEKAQIFYALRGVCLFNDQGHHRNQQLLMNRLQDNKFRRLIYQSIIQYKGDIDKYELNADQAYVTAHFEMFSSLIQSGNMINIGKLENIHPYTYCLECLKSTNRWQIRRAFRTYINRLYYVNKQKDVFLFEQFIRKQFDIINNELHEVIGIHISKGITANKIIKSGIRFKFAISEIMLHILQILVTLHEMLLKSEFKKVLNRELQKEEKYAESSRPLHEKIIKMYRHLGLLNKLYPDNKPVSSLLREVSNHMKAVLENLQARYIQKKTQPEGEGQRPEVDEIGGQTQKKSYIYDYSKSFFRNLTNMIRDIKGKQKLEKLREEYKKRLNRSEHETQKQMKERCLDNIYNISNEKVKPLFGKRRRNQPLYLASYLQTNSSYIFKVLATPELSQNQQNYQLNNRLGLVKKMMNQLPIFQKFKQEQHLLFVRILSRIDQSSCRYYSSNWQKLGEKNLTPVISMKEMISVTFNLMMKSNSIIKDQQKIFVIKLIRCYITEAIEQKQNYKLPVDKWDANYCKQDKNQNGEEKKQFPRRQKLIEQCGGSNFLIFILSQDMGNRIELLNQALLLGIAYLFNGNSDCQNSILKSLKSDKDNKMLLNIRKLIKRIGDFLIEVRANKQNDAHRSYDANIVDTYDFFAEEQFALLKQFGHNINDKYEKNNENNNQFALCRLFRFLQLFCENNNVMMKQFLSAQTNDDDTKKINSVNFIEEACLLLRKFFKIMNSKVVSIPSFLLAFIGEITQLPCIDNQISFIKSTFFEDISYLASYFEQENNMKNRGFDGDQDALNQLLQIFEQGIALALSNFQGNDPVIFSQFMNKCSPKYLWIVMRNNIWFLLKQGYQDLEILSKQQENKKALRETLLKFDEEQIRNIIQLEKQKNGIFEGRTIMILNILSITKKLGDYGKLYKDQQPKVETLKQTLKRQAIQQYRHFSSFICQFEDLLLSIEVSTPLKDQTTNQNLYFPKHPVFEFLSGETKDYIMMQVKRDTRRDKLIQLTKFKENIFTEINSNYQLNYKNKIKFIDKPITSQFCDQVRKSAFLCSMLICTLLLTLVEVDYDTDEMVSQFSYKNFVYKIIVKSLCAIQLGLTIFYCYLWGKMKAGLALEKYHQKVQQDTGIYIEPYQVAKSEESHEGWVKLIQNLNKIREKITSIISQIWMYITTSLIWKWSIEPILALHETQSGFYSLFLFVVGSLLGNFYGVQWFSLHIFDYFATISLLANIFKAILNNIKILVIFSLLAGAFILVFNILSFRTYTPVIYQDDIPEQSCQTIMDCVLELYTSGAIGDDMDSFMPFRFAFDMVYLVFMELLFQNLVGGIMMDAFAELKDKDAARDQDKEGMCYICAITKSDMQKNKETFTKHISRHFLWNYVYYIYCLENKDETDYTGVEYLIKNQLQNQDISWFPDNSQSQGGEVQDMITNLRSAIEKIKTRSEQILKKGIQGIKIGTAGLRHQPAVVNE